MRRLIDSLEWTLAVALVFGAGLVVQAQNVEVDAPGTTIRVGPDKGANGGAGSVKPAAELQRMDRALFAGPAAPAEPTYWIGILGGEVSPELRAHLELEEKGVIVREVVPGSPAEEAGLKQHDIMLHANGEPITGMNVLVEQVLDVGPSKGRVTIDLIRAGQPKTLWVAPAERPAAPPIHQPGFREPFGDRNFGEGFGDGFGDFFGDRDGGFRLRMFGDGLAVDGPNVQLNAPGGVSVNVTSVNGQTRVIVKRGDETWDIDATDPEALEELPPDVRALVEGVLPGPGGVDVDVDVDQLMPDLSGLFERFGKRHRRFLYDGLRDRGRRDLQREMEEMRRQIEAMQQQLGVAPAPAGDPALDEAPPFTPGAPVELEIPAEPLADPEK